MKVLYLIRGLPGSGKTTLAHKLTEWVCEADDYYMVEGEYIWSKDKLKEAHAMCQYNCKLAMRAGIETVAVSNTGVKKWESKAYKLLAEEWGYTVIEIVCKGNFNNIHGVPFEKIEQMRKDWED